MPLASTYRQFSVWLPPAMADTVSPAMDSEESRFKRTLGATILEHRVAHKIPSQGALAKMVGVSEATVRRWEQGTHAPDAWEVRRLCEIFDLEPADLIQPADMTEREIALLRRAGRQIHRTIAQERGAD